jgi:hypothetical protein
MAKICGSLAKRPPGLEIGLLAALPNPFWQKILG